MKTIIYQNLQDFIESCDLERPLFISAQAKGFQGKDQYTHKHFVVVEGTNRDRHPIRWRAKTFEWYINRDQPAFDTTCRSEAYNYNALTEQAVETVQNWIYWQYPLIEDVYNASVQGALDDLGIFDDNMIAPHGFLTYMDEGARGGNWHITEDSNGGKLEYVPPSKS